MRALVLVGDAVEFSALSRWLSERRPLEMEIVPDPQGSNLEPINTLVIELADHDATISVDGTTATLAASETSLGKLAEDVAMFVEHNDIDEPGMHAHLVERRAGDAEAFELMLEGPFLDRPGVTG